MHRYSEGGYCALCGLLVLWLWYSSGLLVALAGAAVAAGFGFLVFMYLPMKVLQGLGRAMEKSAGDDY